jgi:hypothetical protein
LVAKSSNIKSKPNAKKSHQTNDDQGMDNDSDDEADTILSSIFVAKESAKANNAKMLAKTSADSGNNNRASSKAVQGPSCRCVLYSRSPHETATTEAAASSCSSNNSVQSGGEHLYTACNSGSLRCLDSSRSSHLSTVVSSASITWSIENAHNVGITKVFQLPFNNGLSGGGGMLVSGDDVGCVRLWDARMCGGSGNGGRGGGKSMQSNPFDNLMKPPHGCVMQWKVNHDYITDFTCNNDGTTLFASSADGTLSVFDVRFVGRKNCPRSVVLPDIDPHDATTTTIPPPPQSKWETSGYSQSDNQEDELLSLCLIKNSTKLLCGSQQGILSLFSYNFWGDISDRFPGHPQSIDAILKIDEDTVLTGSSDGLVRAVQLLPNTLLGVLGGHDGFPVEGLGWSAGRKLVGSVSHDEYIRLWDASFLNDDDDEDEDDGELEGMEGVDAMEEGDTKAAASTKNNSEDEWEDMDDEEDEGMEDSDSDNSDSDRDGGGNNKPKKRDNLFKSANEEFFEDL